MTVKYTGGCQCGNIRYEIVGTPNPLVVCHCTDCQRQSGSAFGMTLPVNEDSFRITRGKVKTYASTSAAGRGKLGAFCPDCGTRIYHKPEWRKGTVSVKPGTLDDTSWLKPEMHLWTSSHGCRCRKTSRRSRSSRRSPKTVAQGQRLMQ